MKSTFGIFVLQVAYHGRPGDVVNDLASLGLYCPDMYNPADFISKH